MGRNWTPTSLFDVFGDDLAREILVMASEQPVSTDAIAEHSDASLPTIYRRLDTLEELDLLTERQQIDDSGNQYREFETTLKRVSFEIDDGGFNIDMRIRRDLSDRFRTFWDEFEETSGRELGGATSTRENSGSDSTHG